MTKIMWKAEYSSGVASLTQFMVERETPKQYVVGRKEMFLGFAWVGKTVKKDSLGLFENMNDAMLYLYEQSENAVKDAQARLDKAIVRRNEVADIIRQMGKEPIPPPPDLPRSADQSDGGRRLGGQ